MQGTAHFVLEARKFDVRTVEYMPSTILVAFRHMFSDAISYVESSHPSPDGHPPPPIDPPPPHRNKTNNSSSKEIYTHNYNHGKRSNNLRLLPSQALGRAAAHEGPRGEGCATRKRR